MAKRSPSLEQWVTLHIAALFVLPALAETSDIDDLVAAIFIAAAITVNAIRVIARYIVAALQTED